MVTHDVGVALDLQAGERQPVGRGAALNLRDVTPVAGGCDVRPSQPTADDSPVTRRVVQAYVEVARQMTAYLAARQR